MGMWRKLVMRVFLNIFSQDDTLWLQRDFGIYPRNVFNTQCAAKILGIKFFRLYVLLTNGQIGLDLSLHACVQHYFGIELNKEEQTADWRIRFVSFFIL